MTPEKVIELAMQAGFYDGRAELFWAGPNDLQRFAELLRSQLVDEVRQEVRNEVLEEAAKSCNELIEADNSDDYKAGVTWCAMRIEGMKK